MKKRLHALMAFLLALSAGTYTLDATADFNVDLLRCEYVAEPLGIDIVKPRLSWQVTSEKRGEKQTAYQIQVASSAEKLAAGKADLWDSGKVSSDDSLNVVYGGVNLASRGECFWQVRVWGANEKASSWSVASHWTMGLLGKQDWQASWISYKDDTPVFTDTTSLFLPAARQYRKEFSAQGKTIQRAVVYSSALGIYELNLNGQRVNDGAFNPGWSDYNQSVYYNTYDVTDLMQGGDNALSAWVADGWYSGYIGFGLLTGMGTEKIGRYTYGKTPSVMMQLEIEYEDGSRQIIHTDKSWKVTGDGPIREADLLMGEFYDARLETPGWMEPGFNDASWESAILAAENGSTMATFYEGQNPDKAGNAPKITGREVDLGFKQPRLESFPGVPVVVSEELECIEVVPHEAGKYIFNLGQNFAGTIRLNIKGEAGHRATIRYGEMLHPDGTLMTENLRKARAQDTYICKGDPAGEVFVPRFTFHGFQYVEIVNFPGEPTKDTVTGLALHSDTKLTSTFTCSDPMVNRLFQNIVWTQRSNFLDLPTDCPQRDERMGWTGDAQVYVGTAIYNADVAAFYTKWLRELMAAQRPSGAFTDFAPFPFQHGWDFGTAWGDAGVICPWTIWQAYDDVRIIETCWEPMTRFMKWRKDTSRDNLGIAHGNDWGDWLAQGGKTPLEFVDTIYFAISSKKMSEMAAAIGRNDESTAYAEQFENIKTAFNAKYVEADGSVNVPTQTAQVLALFADLIPEDTRKATGQKLADMIAENENRMSTGFLGTRPLLPVLSSVGQHDLAVLLLQSHDFPSWGYEVDQGATTIWERWDSYTKEDGFGRHNAAMNSFSHYSFGAVCEWMFCTLAGIESDGPGFNKITIQPTPATRGSNPKYDVIDWVKSSYDSIHGTIVSNWKVDGDQFILDVTIPTNTSATLYLPSTERGSVREGDNPVSKAAGVAFLRQEADRTVLSLDSGKYHFEATWATDKNE